MNLNLESHNDKVEVKHKVWNDTLEKVIGDIQTSCKDYKYMHVEACKTASRKYDITMYIIIALGPISSILASTYDTGARSNSYSNQFIQIFLSMISGVLSAIIKFSKFEHQATVHRATSLKFASLENNIKRQLTLKPEDRQPADKYLDWVIHSFDELFNSSPIVVDTVFKKWSKERKEEEKQLTETHVCKEHSQEEKEPEPPSSVPPSVPPSVPSPRPKYPLEELDYNSFSDGKMNYELARLRRD